MRRAASAWTGILAVFTMWAAVTVVSIDARGGKEQEGVVRPVRGPPPPCACCARASPTPPHAALVTGAGKFKAMLANGQPAPGYAGDAVCLECHEAQGSVNKTAHGRIKNPRTPGGQQWLRELPRSRPGARRRRRQGQDPALRQYQGRCAHRQRDVPVLPHQGPARIVGRQRARLAQPRVRVVPQRARAEVGRRPVEGRDADGVVPDVPSAAGRQAPARLTHARHRGQDGVLLVPQPARDGQRQAAQGGQLAERVVHQLPHGEARAVPARARRGPRQLHQLPRPARLAA